MRSIVTILLISSMLACVQDDLVDTTWEYTVGPNCTNYFYFSQDSAQEYDCEMAEYYMGTYHIQHDTVVVRTSYGEFDYEFPVGSRHRHEPVEYRLIRVDDNTIYEPRSALTYTLLVER